MIVFILILVAIAGILTTKRTVFAAALILLFLTIGIQRTFTEFDLPVGVDFEGTEVFETTEVCGKAVPLLLNVSDQQADLASGQRRNCLKASRTRVVEAFIAFIVGAGGAAVGWKMIPALAPTPIDEVLNPLPRIDQKPTGRTDSRP